MLRLTSAINGKKSLSPKSPYSEKLDDLLQRSKSATPTGNAPQINGDSSLIAYALPDPVAASPQTGAGSCMNSSTAEVRRDIQNHEEFQEQIVSKLHAKVDEILEESGELDFRVLSNSAAVAARTQKRETARHMRPPLSILTTISDITQLRSVIENFRTEVLQDDLSDMNETSSPDQNNSEQVLITDTSPSTAMFEQFPSPASRHHTDIASPRHSTRIRDSTLVKLLGQDTDGYNCTSTTPSPQRYAHMPSPSKLMFTDVEIGSDLRRSLEELRTPSVSQSHDDNQRSHDVH